MGWFYFLCKDYLKSDQCSYFAKLHYILEILLKTPFSLPLYSCFAPAFLYLSSYSQCWDNAKRLAVQPHILYTSTVYLVDGESDLACASVYGGVAYWRSRRPECWRARPLPRSRWSPQRPPPRALPDPLRVALQEGRDLTEVGEGILVNG